MAKAAQSPITVGKILQSSWVFLKANYLAVGAVMLLSVVASMIFSWLMIAMFGEASTIGNLLNQVFSVMVSVGMIKALLDLTAKRPVDFTSILQRPQIFWNYFAASVVYGLIVVVGLILFIVPGIIWAVKYGEFACLVVDRQMGPLAALRASAKITQGRRWVILWFGLATIGLNILGLLALVVGLFVTVPLTAVAQVELYRRLVAGQKV